MGRRALWIAFAAIAAATAPVIAGPVVQGNFGRSPAYPTTPNGRFPQETAQIIEFKQRQVLQQQGHSAEAASALASRGIMYSALAFVGLGEDNYTIAQRLGWVAAAGGAAGAAMCYTGYGCALGGPLMIVSALAGLGSATICLVADCSIQANGNGAITGSDVRSITSQESPTNHTQYLTVNEAYWGEGWYNDHFSMFGVLQEFIAKDHQGKYRRALIIPYTVESGTLRSPFGDRVSSSNYVQPNYAAARCTNFAPAINNACSDGFRWTAAGTATNCGSYSKCVLFYSSTYATSPNGLVTYKYTPVQQIGPLDIGNGEALPPEAAAKPVHPSLMANVANDIWRRQGANAPVPFSDALAVTDADVAAYRQAYPDRASTLGDLARPVNAPGQPPSIGPIDRPVAPPQQVEVVNPQTPSQGSSDREEPDTELDNNEGLLGDIMQPAREFLSGPFAEFLTPGIQLPDAQCPVISIDLPTLLGRQDLSRPENSQFVCDWLVDQRPKFILILNMMYTVAALVIVFRSS